MCYYILVARERQERSPEMEKTEGMTNEQFNKFLQTLLHILENEGKEKAIELLKSLITK